MQAEWEPDELIDAWTLTGGDWDLIANKAGVTRLGFAVMLKFYEIEGRFPAYPEEVPPAAVRYLGSLVKSNRRCLPGTPGRAGRSSTTGPRSARSTGRARRPRTMRNAGRSGWPRSCARPRRPLSDNGTVVDVKEPHRAGLTPLAVPMSRAPGGVPSGFRSVQFSCQRGSQPSHWGHGRIPDRGAQAPPVV